MRLHFPSCVSQRAKSPPAVPMPARYGSPSSSANSESCTGSRSPPLLLLLEKRPLPPLRFHPYPAILAVRELFGRSLTATIFLSECCLMQKRSPTAGAVRDGYLVYEQQGQQVVVLLDTPSWYTWLETATSFTFTGDEGTFTAHKAAAGNRRGGWYWRAYRRKRGRLSRCYLGVSPNLTLSNLREAARRLATDAERTRSEKADKAAPPVSHVPVLVAGVDADRDPPDQHYAPAPAGAAYCAPTPARAPGAGPARAVDARLGSCWLWQDHPAGSLGGHDHAAGGLAFLRREGKRPGALAFRAHRCSGAPRRAPGHRGRDRSAVASRRTRTGPDPSPQRS